MKFTAIAALTLASVAAAAPSPGPGNAVPKCKPGTYRCARNNGAPSWDTCDITGTWVFSGNCPPKTVCKFYDPSGSPYCVPPSFEFP
jgi:hypothetical protein